MITNKEIQAKSLEFGINPSDIQRDYVFGWLIAGIFRESPLGECLTLKGGNALRKGYLPLTRFSADVDLSSPVAVEQDKLVVDLNEVCRFVQSESGVTFDFDRNQVASTQSIDKERSVYKARLYFKDFSGNADHLTLKIRVDVTEFDRLLLQPQERQLIHQYSDADKCTATVKCVALEEALADKLKCLLQRCYSFDLFDLVYGVFVDHALEVDRRLIVTTFLRKTIFEQSPPTALRLLLGTPFELMRSFWDNLICPQVSQLSFDTATRLIRDGLTTLFRPFSYGSNLTGAFFPSELRNPILQAGSDLTLLRVKYDGITRLAEPYSLVFKRRKDGVGQEYLYVFDQTGGRKSDPGTKSWLWHRIQALESTDIRFEPRVEVELSKAGDRDKVGDFRAQSIAGRSRGGRTRPRFVRPPRYVVACPSCGREFPRVKTSARLREHNDGYGNRCPGRIGYRVR